MTDMRDVFDRDPEFNEYVNADAVSPDERPFLARIGANTREAAGTVNLDVSATVGPDYLGQETVDVDGHSCDRPGVTSRRPEQDPDDQRIARMDTGEELPVLLSSSMRSDPIEGTQGSFTRIIEGTCARCGYDRLRETVHTLAGETRRECNACGAVQDRHAENGYSMPTTEEERIDNLRDAAEKIGSLTSIDVFDMEESTGAGPMIALARDRTSMTFYKSGADDLFWMLVDNGDINLAEAIRRNVNEPERAVLGASILPEQVLETLDLGDHAGDDE